MYGIFHILFLWIEIHEIRTAIYTGSPIQVLGIIFIYYMLEYEKIKNLLYESYRLFIVTN